NNFRDLYLILTRDVSTPSVYPSALGEGGAGVVFLAEQTLHEKARIKRAIKFFLFREDILDRIDTTNPVGSDSFAEEIFNLSSFNHENVLKVIEAGVWDCDNDEVKTLVPFLVTELQEGPTLKEIISKRKISDWTADDPNTIVEWMLQLCRGLAHLHDKNFYHCDIAPKNIFVQGPAGNCHLVIGDLGAVRSTLGSAPFTLIGTRDYSPRDVVDEFGKVWEPSKFSALQPRWDLFALAKTLDELLVSAGDFASRNDWFDSAIRLLDDLRNGRISSIEDFAGRVEWLRPIHHVTAGVPELTDSGRSTKRTLLPLEPALTSKRIRRVIYHPNVLRLKRLHQITLGPAIFAGASHTRYEHAIGCYQVMRRYLNALISEPEFLRDFTPQIGETALISAALHNVIRLPLGPAIEEIRSRNESMLKELAAGSIWNRILDTNGGGAESIRDVLKEDFPLVNLQDIENIIFNNVKNVRDKRLRIVHFLLNSSIDCRVMDYLRRDSLHIGVARGDSFDIGELLSHLYYSESRLYVRTSGLSVVEQIIALRYWMFSRIYWNMPHRSINAMVSEILVGLAESHGAFAANLAEQILNFSERDLLGYCRRLAADKSLSGVVEICDMLLEPRPLIYTEVFQMNRAEDGAQARTRLEQISKMLFSEYRDLQQGLDQRIQVEYGLSEERVHVVIDFPVSAGRHKLGDDLDVVTHRGGYLALPKISMIVAGASNGFMEQLQRLRVFVNPTSLREINSSGSVPIEDVIDDYFAGSIS
ncbi:MAG: protein kinase, partial [Planctomycetota bacterium]